MRCTGSPALSIRSRTGSASCASVKRTSPLQAGLSPQPHWSGTMARKPAPSRVRRPSHWRPEAEEQCSITTGSPARLSAQAILLIGRSCSGGGGEAVAGRGVAGPGLDLVLRFGSPLGGRRRGRGGGTEVDEVGGVEHGGLPFDL